MAIETATYIDELDAANPVGSTDTVATLDNHIRLLKSVLQATFPNIDAAVTSNPTELNLLDGIVSYTGTGTAIVKSVAPAITGTATFEALTATGTVTGNLFSGSGASLTALNASNLSSGTIPDARFPATLPALNGSALTNLNMGAAASGTLAVARGGTGVTTQAAITRANTLAWTIQSDPGGTPSGTAGDVFAYY